MRLTIATLLFGLMSSLSAANAAPATPAQPAAPDITVVPATGAATVQAAQTAGGTAPATAAADAQVMTITLTNLNQIVGVIVERDKECMTLKTSEGLFKLRLNKVLREDKGGTVESTTGTTGAATDATASGRHATDPAPLAGPGGKNNKAPAKGGAAAAASTTPLSQMAPDERIKAAQKKLEDATKNSVTYRQAIQTHVGGVPAGQTPTTYNPNQQPNGAQQQAPYGQSGPSWQPFSGDNPKSNTNQNQQQQNQNGYTPYTIYGGGYQNGANNGYGTYYPSNNNAYSNNYQNVPPSQMFYLQTQNQNR